MNTKQVCERHGSTIIIYSEECPLCKRTNERLQLIQLMVDMNLLARLPPYHFWSVVGGQIRVVGPDIGYCFSSEDDKDNLCSHGLLPESIMLPNITLVHSNSHS